MANILVALSEETSRAFLEAGRSGVGGLQGRELGYSDAAGEQEFSFLTAASAFRHLPTRERLLYAPSAALAGSNLLGYFPSNGMSAVTVQNAIDELRTMVSGAGGGTVGGSGTAGTLPYFSASNVLANSILSQVSSKLLFSGDTVANVYRSSAGLLASDGAFLAEGGLFSNGAADLGRKVMMALDYQFDNSVSNLDYSVLIAPTLNKNNTNVRNFYGLNIVPEIAAGGSNTNTNFFIVNIDPQETTATGVATTMLRLGYNGQDRFLFDRYTMWQRNNGNCGFVMDAAGPFARAEYSNRIARGTLASPTDVQDADIGFIFYSSAYSGSTFQEGAKIQTVIDGSFTSGQTPPQRIEFYTAPVAGSDVLRMTIMSNGNFGLLSQSFGAGVGVFAIGNCTTAPSSNPSGGGVLYASAGALVWRGSGGTVTTLATA